MDGFWDYLYMYLTEERLPHAGCSRAHLLQSKREEAALDALLDTFSEEQMSLYLHYEDAANGLSDLEMRQVFRETVFLARELFR